MPELNTNLLASIGQNTPSLGKAFQLKDLIDESQLNELKINQAKQEYQTDQQVREVFKNIKDPSDPKQLAEAVAQVTKIDPKTGMALGQQVTDLATAKNRLSDEQLKLLNDQNDTIGNALIGVKDKYDLLVSNGTPPAQAEAMVTPLYIQTAQQLYQQQEADGTPMLDKQHMQSLQQNPTYKDDVVNKWIQGSASSRAALQKEIELRQTAASQTETHRHNVETEKQGQQKVDIQQEKLKQGLASGNLDPDTIDDLATQYNLTGKLPPLGRGDNAMKFRAQVLNAAAKQLKGAGQNEQAAIVAQAGLKAGQQAYGSLKKSQAMVGNYEKTAIKNMELVRQKSAKVDRTGSPILNKWILAGRKELAGDPAVTDFNTAVTTFVEEYAKVMTGSTGASAATDSARNHAYDLINTSQTPEQLESNLKTLGTEMSNRMSSYDEQLQELQGQMGVGIPNKNTQAPGASTAAKPLSDEDLVKKYGGG